MGIIGRRFVSDFSFEVSIVSPEPLLPVAGQTGSRKGVAVKRLGGFGIAVLEKLRLN